MYSSVWYISLWFIRLYRDHLPLIQSQGSLMSDTLHHQLWRLFFIAVSGSIPCGDWWSNVKTDAAFLLPSMQQSDTPACLCVATKCFNAGSLHLFFPTAADAKYPS